MLFQPSNIYPSTFSGIGAGTVDVTQGINVSWQVNGDTPMTAYQIKIYQNDSGSTLMYDSGSVSVSPVFEPHDKNGNATYFTAIISAAALSTAGIVNGYQYGYKMLITQWWGVSDYVEQTSASVFITRSTPTLAINTITTPVASSSLTITANYSQAQGDPISTVEWVFALAGSESTPIRKTGAISTQVLSFDADGLITGNTYSIMCKVVTSTGMEASTGFVQFPVSYSSSSLGINYQLAQLKNSSAVYLSWDDLGSNKLAYPYTDTTKTTNGITFTVNGEGDVVATGTATADAYFTIAQGTLSQLGITAGQKFIVTSGYSGSKIVITETNSSNVVVSTITGNDPLQYIATSTTNTLKFSIVIPSGSVLSSGRQLKPMIAIEDKIVALNDVSVTMQPIQDLHGYANPWIGTDYDQQPYNFRAVSSSSVSPLGNSEMGNIVGGTVAWNQLVENGNFASTTGWFEQMGSISAANNELTYTVSTIGVHYYDNQVHTSASPYAYNIPKDHVVLLSCETYAPYSNGFYMSARTKQIGQGGVGISNVTLTPNVWNKVSKIAKLNNTLTDIAFYWSMDTTYQVGDSVKLRNVIIIDLTQMFGSTIADYLYGLESGTAGAGVAKLKSWGFCTKPYYAYDAGSLQSVQTSAHKTVGFNQWDEEWERGTIGMSTGQKVDSNDKIRSKNYVPILPNTTYYFKMPGNWRMCYYDANKNLLENGNTYDPNRTLTSPDGAYYLRFAVDGTTTYANNVCINISKSTGTPKNGDYVAYAANTYALDSSLTLRGIPKLDANNNLYYDGDSYAPDGTVTRRYGTITLDGVTSGKKFIGAWGTGTSNPYGYAVYITFVRTKTQNVCCDKFVYSYRDRDNMPLYSFVGNSGIPDTWTFVLPSTITSLAEANTWLSNNPTTIVYELETPTTESVTAYAATQSIDPDGTEEYVDYAESQGTRDVAIPVGHYTNYANICPISGRTGLTVYDDPKYGGLIEWNQQLYFDSDNWTINGMQCSVNNGRFTLAGTATTTGTSALVPSRIYNKTKLIQGHVYALILSGDTNLNSFVFTVYGTPNQTINLNTIQSVIFTCNSANSTDAEFVARYNRDEEYSADITSYLCDLTLAFGAGNEPTTVEEFRNLFPKDYYPYNAGEQTCVSAVNGDPYWKKDIDWTTSAGTVYGGTLDVVTGVLTVDMASVDMGTLTWAKNWAPNADPTGVFYSPIISNIDINKSGICTSYAYATGNPNAVPDKSFTMYGSGRIYVKDTSYDDATNFKTAVSGVIVVYELATPLTYQLTPTQVAVLTGTNNVWSTGDSVSVTYTKDTGSQATLSGAIVTFSDSNAVLIPTPQYIPGITGISIYRYLQGESALQHVYDLATGATSILDYYAPSQMQVSYLIVAHSGIGDLFLQTTKFTPTFWFFSILLCDTDSNGEYHVSKEYIFKYGVETGAVSNNNDPTIQKNFTPYPNRQPISSLYKTGKLTSYIGKTNSQNQYSDSVSLQNAIYDISTSPLTKFLKTRKGDILMIDTAAAIQMKTEDNTVQQALKATVDWVEVGDASNKSIVSVPTDSFWPIS